MLSVLFVARQCLAQRIFVSTCLLRCAALLRNGAEEGRREQSEATTASNNQRNGQPASPRYGSYAWNCLSAPLGWQATAGQADIDGTAAAKRRCLYVDEDEDGRRGVLGLLLASTAS